MKNQCYHELLTIIINCDNFFLTVKSNLKHEFCDKVQKNFFKRYSDFYFYGNIDMLTIQKLLTIPQLVAK